MAEMPALAAPFTVGICASDSEERLPDLLTSITSEDFGDQFVLERVVVVASGCPPNLLARMETVAGADDRILVIKENERKGKAEALNRIMLNSVGEYLVFLNADALPARGAIGRLLKELSVDSRAGCVSARPVFHGSGGLLSRVLGLMWSAHNTASLRLNHAMVSNHSSDELLAVRRNLLTGLPPDLVNDGAYIGGRLKADGHLIKFSEAAVVSISVPRKPADLIEQRRRIIFGHVQVWRKLGTPPKTVESLLFTDPAVGLRILVSMLSDRPVLVSALPFAIVMEILSAVMAMTDLLRSTARHTVWKRYEN